MEVSKDAPRRPAGRFAGGKWRQAPWTLEHIPERHDVYLEPYSGLASTLLRKPRSPIEVLNDKDDDVVTYLSVLRDRPEELVRAIELTPFAKREWEQSFEPTDDPLEKARRFYVRSYLSIAGPTAQYQNGWRRQKVLSRGKRGAMTPAAKSFMRVDHLYDIAERLRGVWIECDDALAVIERYDQPEALLYIDPPYVPGTRKPGIYQHEMDEADHKILADLLHGIKGMVVLSGYRCPLYDVIYSDWVRVDKQARINGDGKATESLWLNPALTERLHEETLLESEKEHD